MAQLVELTGDELGGPPISTFTYEDSTNSDKGGHYCVTSSN
jgi:hypothetical protein